MGESSGNKVDEGHSICIPWEGRMVDLFCGTCRNHKKAEGLIRVYTYCGKTGDRTDPGFYKDVMKIPCNKLFYSPN